MQMGTNYVLDLFLNAVVVTQLRMSMGREFHTLDVQEWTSPYEDNVFGIERKSLSEDLRDRVGT